MRLAGTRDDDTVEYQRLASLVRSFKELDPKFMTEYMHCVDNVVKYSPWPVFFVGANGQVGHEPLARREPTLGVYAGAAGKAVLVIGGREVRQLRRLPQIDLNSGVPLTATQICGEYSKGNSLITYNDVSLVYFEKVLAILDAAFLIGKQATPLEVETVNARMEAMKESRKENKECLTVK
jgi:hypothetical protein